jgi:hypothetical protein
MDVPVPGLPLNTRLPLRSATLFDPAPLKRHQMDVRVLSQRIRKRIEEPFSWAKTIAGLRKMQHRQLPKVDWKFTLAMASTIHSAPSTIAR